MIERMELGEFYKELRLARKLKQSDVACEGLTASQLSKFELGQSMLSADKLILAIQGINMNFLVITLLYQGNNQIYQNRKSEISIRKNIKYAIF